MSTNLTAALQDLLQNTTNLKVLRQLMTLFHLQVKRDREGDYISICSPRSF